MDIAQHRVWFSDSEISLSPTEFTLLETMVLRVDNVLSPQELVKATHNYTIDAIQAGSIIRPLISSLRRKLKVHHGEESYIENVRGIGYRLCCPE